MSDIPSRRKQQPAQPYQETPDFLFQAKSNYKAAQEDLIDFVSKQIDLMKEHLLFAGQDNPGFYQLNRSLMDYQSIALGLISLHNEARIEYDISKEIYDDYYAEKFSEVKLEQINLGKSAQYTAQRDIELAVRKRYMTELSKLKADIILKENRYNFTNYLIKGWENYSFILSQLSKNAQAEAIASGVSYKNPVEFGDEND